MSCDEVHSSSVVLSVVAECSVQILDNVDVIKAKCQFGVSGTIS